MPQQPAYPMPPGYAAHPPMPAADGPTRTLADIEMEYILQTYAKNKFNKQRTADELGISLKTLYNKLRKYEEERQHRAG
jgi:DNA-binding NtrC family response regulator